MINKELIDSICNQYLNDYPSLDDGEDRLFHRLFHTEMKNYAFCMSNKKQVYIWNRLEDDDDDDDNGYMLDVSEFIKGLISNPEIYCKTYITGDGGVRYLFIGDNFLINSDRMPVDNYYIPIFATDRKYIAGLTEYIHKIESKKHYYFINVGNRGCYSTQFEVNKIGNASLDNYNDDLPYDNLLNFCNSDDTGIALLYGIPGSGKSTLIKKLITNATKTFYLLNVNVLDSIDYLFDFLLGHKDSVLVIEDCEKLLRSRESGNNSPSLSALLNLSDGILGDSLKLKFICTFNTDLTQIDKALLRKGRLKLKYEFKKLQYEKAKKIGDKLGVEVKSDITLADLYNADTENDFSKKKQSQIGFNKC